MSVRLVFWPRLERRNIRYVSVLDVFDMSFKEALEKMFERYDLQDLDDDFEMCVNNDRYYDWSRLTMRDILAPWLEDWLVAVKAREQLPTLGVQLKFPRERRTIMQRPIAS